MTESFRFKDGIVKMESRTPFHDDRVGDSVWSSVEIRLGSQLVALAGCSDGMSAATSYAVYQALDVLASAIEQIFKENSGVYGCDDARRSAIASRILKAGRQE